MYKVAFVLSQVSNIRAKTTQLLLKSANILVPKRPHLVPTFQDILRSYYSKVKLEIIIPSWYTFIWYPKSAFFILKFMAFKNHITKICSKTSKKVFYKTKDTKKFLCAHAFNVQFSYQKKPFGVVKLMPFSSLIIYCTIIKNLRRLYFYIYSLCFLLIFALFYCCAKRCTTWKTSKTKPWK